jgi:tRNA G18 (ribose-2'-O)-methylase SpoU
VKAIVLTKETNEIQRVLTLRQSRNKRHRYQEFILEGVVAFEQAFEHGWAIKTLFYNKDIELSSWAQLQLETYKQVTIYAVSSEIMAKMSDKDTPSELLALAQMQRLQFADYKPRPTDVVVVLDEPKSPGNMGMMIRSAVAFGATALVISGHGADEYDPQCIRASVGTFFSLPIYKVEGVTKFQEHLERLKNYTISVIASGDRGSTPLDQVDFNPHLLFLILGNETHGISVGYRLMADQFVKIPLDGAFTSLNIAAAGSIFLYEIFKQRAHLRIDINRPNV